jgi:hypothetical protein
MSNTTTRKDTTMTISAEHEGMKNMVADVTKRLLGEFDDLGKADPMRATAMAMTGLGAVNAAIIASLFKSTGDDLMDDVIVKLAEQTRRIIKSYETGMLEPSSEKIGDIPKSMAAAMLLKEAGGVPSAEPGVVQSAMKVLMEDAQDEDNVKVTAKMIKNFIALITSWVILQTKDEGRQVIWEAIKMGADLMLKEAPPREEILKQAEALKH